MKENKEGELVDKRISDWTQAESSAETGRDVVHKFTVRKPNGEIVTASSESIPTLLGYVKGEPMKGLPSVVSAVKTLAKQRMQLAILEAQEKEYNTLKEKYEKAEKPEIVEAENRFARDGRFSTYAMGDARVNQDNKYNPETKSYEKAPLEKENIENLEREWVENRVEEDGGKYPRDINELKQRIKRQERRVEEATKSKISIKEEAPTARAEALVKEAEEAPLTAPALKDVESTDRIGGHQMSKTEYEALREKEQDLLYHAKSMSYQYENLQDAKNKGASKKDIDKWIEFGKFIKKYDTTFHHDAQIRFAIGQRLPIAKKALMSAPKVVEEIKKELISGELRDSVKNKNIELSYAKSLIDNSGIYESYEKAKASNSNPELVKAVEELLGAKETTTQTEFTSKQEGNASTEFDGIKKPSKIKTKSFDNKYGNGAFERMQNITQNFEDIMDNLSDKIKQDCI
jgi:hypothetical protein